MPLLRSLDFPRAGYLYNRAAPNGAIAPTPDCEIRGLAGEEGRERAGQTGIHQEESTKGREINRRLRRKKRAARFSPPTPLPARPAPNPSLNPQTGKLATRSARDPAVPPARAI